MIQTKHHKHIFEIILNRPEKRNAMQIQMLRQIGEAVLEAQQTPQVRLIVLRAEGPAFSVGLDLQTMGGMIEEFGEDWMQQPHTLTRMWQAPVNILANASIPTLALIHGYCLGVGLELALACDFRYATPDAQLSLAETRIGLIPDVGGTTRLMALVGIARAKEMIFTARRIDGITAERWGIVNQVVEVENLPQSAVALADEIALCAPLAVSAAKRVIQGIADESRGLYLEALEQANLFATQDLQEGVQSVLMRRDPQWKWQ
ncbi:MAG: hypothetical protein CUN55_07955 [Phototrophicales bacterium]|nr:MAG: hypothetical protein CUN55_07955 [Phototrophicales bacterium]